ncbi:MAG: lipid A deacylase LpxR family protein [Thermodesulfobacteriota bacterium]
MKQPLYFLSRLALTLAVVGVLGGWLQPCLAQGQQEEQGQTVSVFFENDLFANTDKYYTNAFQMTLLSPDLTKYRNDHRLPDWSLPLIQRVPFVNAPQSTHNVGLLLGQHIYTPANIKTKTVPTTDRPYAGFLYAGVALHSKTSSQLDTMEAVGGMVGPSALGEEAQNGVHSMRGFDLAQGWETQLHDEPGIRLAWQRKYRPWRWDSPGGWGADCLPHLGATLGNVKTAANTGAEVRFGYRVPHDFGTDSIRPGAGISAPLPSGPSNKWGRLGAHIFAGLHLQAIAHTIFLDGNTWRKSRHVKKRPLVAEASVGFAVTFERIKLTYRHLLRTQEFKHQDQGQAIGSLTLTWAF